MFHRFHSAVGRAVGALCLAAMLSAASNAGDPVWYDDIEYLTWDVRADEAEAARAAGGGGTVYLHLPAEDRERTWYYSSGSGLRPTSLISECQSQLTSWGRRFEAQASRWRANCWGQGYWGQGDSKTFRQTADSR